MHFSEYLQNFFLKCLTGGANSSTRKQNGRGPHIQKREIYEPDQRARKCQLQICGDAC